MGHTILDNKINTGAVQNWENGCNANIIVKLFCREVPRIVFLEDFLSISVLITNPVTSNCITESYPSAITCTLCFVLY